MFIYYKILEKWTNINQYYLKLLVYQSVYTDIQHHFKFPRFGHKNNLGIRVFILSNLLINFSFIHETPRSLIVKLTLLPHEVHKYICMIQSLPFTEKNHSLLYLVVVECNWHHKLWGQFYGASYIPPQIWSDLPHKKWHYWEEWLSCSGCGLVEVCHCGGGLFSFTQTTLTVVCSCFCCPWIMM